MKQYTVLHTEASTGWGGQEIRIISESAGMIERGHRVLLVCQPTSVISRKASEQGIETFVMPLRGAFDIKGISRLRALYRDEKVDIVNTHSSRDSWCAGLAAKLSGDVKVIRTRHLSIPIKRNFESRLLYHTLPDVVITTGEGIRDHIIERTERDPDSVISIPTGIDLDKFNPAGVDGSKTRAEFGTGDGGLLIGSVGMLRSMKGFGYYLEAASLVREKYPQAKFLIVGDIAFTSNIKEDLAKQIAGLDMKKSVIMTGYRDDIPEIMAALDVFVLASIRSEGVPQTITQAMAMKKPVVATNVGCISEQVIEGETGLLAEKANSKELARGILKILGDRDLAARMGENGRKLVEGKLSLEAMLDATESVYHRLLAA